MTFKSILGIYFLFIKRNQLFKPKFSEILLLNRVKLNYHFETHNLFAIHLLGIKLVTVVRPSRWYNLSYWIIYRCFN